MSRLTELCHLIEDPLNHNISQKLVIARKLARAAKKMQWGLENSCFCTGELGTEKCDACQAIIEAEKILNE